MRKSLGVIEVQSIPREIEAVDVTLIGREQAGYGDFVYLVGSKEAARVFHKPLPPADAAVVGFIDPYREEL